MYLAKAIFMSFLRDLKSGTRTVLIHILEPIARHCGSNEGTSGSKRKFDFSVSEFYSRKSLCLAP